MLRLILFLSILGIGSPCSAAEIKVISSTPITQARIIRGECTATLTGEIQKGDVKKIEALDTGGVRETSVALRFETKSAGSDEYQPKARALCLADSGGGNFLEALALADYFRSNGWVTVVPRNGRCLSACAIAFLGGSLLSSNSNGGERAPFRIMDVSATVGFHAPLFPKSFDPKELVPFAFVLDFLQDGMASIQKLRATLAEDDFPSAGPTLPATLLLDMLSHVGSDNFVYVDSIDKAGAYNIRLAGVQTLPIDANALFRLCDNAVSWAFGLHRLGDAALTSWSYEICKTNKNKDADCAAPGVGKALIDNLRKGVKIQSRHQFCLVEGGPNLGDDYQVSFRRVDGTEFNRSFEPWATLPHYVPLANLTAQKGGVDVQVRELKLLDNSEPGSLSLSAFLQALPGDILVADGQSLANESLIINFGKDGTAEILWPEGPIDRSPYSLTSDGVCFTNIKGHPGRVCAHVRFNKETDAWNWSFGALYPDVIIRFQRPGRVLPPSIQTSNG